MSPTFGHSAEFLDDVEISIDTGEWGDRPAFRIAFVVSYEALTKGDEHVTALENECIQRLKDVIDCGKPVAAKMQAQKEGTPVLDENDTKH